MSNEKERFLQAEETATKLVETLNQLKNQIIEYNIVAKELEEIKISFISFIEKMENLAKSYL